MVPFYYYSLSLFLGAFIALLSGLVVYLNDRKIIRGQKKNLESANAELAEANEKLKKLDRQKSEFVSIASHQLRSPLTVIKGYLSMFIEGDAFLGDIAHGTVTPKGAAALAIMFQSAERLTHIIDDFLNVSNIEQGRMKYDMADLDIRQMAAELVTGFRAEADDKDLTLTFDDRTPSDGYMVRADSSKLRQVIGNVIDNSIKYTPEGGIAVSLERTPSAVRISIQDTGIGISAEDLKNLFQKFSRAANARKVNVTGSGLGLFVGVEILRAHGGRLWAESAGEGKGSTFIIELPVK